MIDAGVPKQQARKSISDSYRYFEQLRESNCDNIYFDI
ncbi:hypothetical protein MXF34_09515 [Klebsiella aerogenes]|nr:hypothetical protein [Klebsiella aerogenes]MEB5840904.1 hypothetical protein [Klebsiella aerogenes]MEB5894668.1 hypothetical protein [Klebsiella aerogenes]